VRRTAERLLAVPYSSSAWGLHRRSVRRRQQCRRRRQKVHQPARLRRLAVPGGGRAQIDARRTPNSASLITGTPSRPAAPRPSPGWSAAAVSQARRLPWSPTTAGLNPDRTTRPARDDRDGRSEPPSGCQSDMSRRSGSGHRCGQAFQGPRYTRDEGRSSMWAVMPCSAQKSSMRWSRASHRCLRS